MTPSSRRQLIWSPVVVLGWSLWLQSCSSIGPATVIPVTDVRALRGRWEGIVYLPGYERDDVTLNIRDDGSYDVVSKRGLDVTTGKGRILAREGRLVIEGNRGRGAGTLLRSPAGDELIKLDMTLSDNRNLSAELWRMH